MIEQLHAPNSSNTFAVSIKEPAVSTSSSNTNAIFPFTFPITVD